jgi:hypothetical protein
MCDWLSNNEYNVGGKKYGLAGALVVRQWVMARPTNRIKRWLSSLSYAFIFRTTVLEAASQAC